MNALVGSTLQPCQFVRRRLSEGPVFHMGGCLGASRAEESLTVFCLLKSPFSPNQFSLVNSFLWIKSFFKDL